MEELTQDLVKELFEYEDGKLFWRVNKSKKIKVGDLAGCLRKDGYRQININGKFYKEHRLIYLYHHGYLPKELDHENRIRDYNRIENLREATKSQNHGNETIRKNGTSIFKGVCWHKQAKKWGAHIMINGKQKHLGYFHNEQEAALTYNKAAIEIFDEYANLNII